MYPTYMYFPRWRKAPAWIAKVAQVFLDCRPFIDTAHATNKNKSDAVLETLRPGLSALGFDVESGKSRGAKLHRPVFFEENGKPGLQYEIDAYHPGEQIALEVEAARATLGNAIYRDLIQMSLLVDVAYAAVAVPVVYRYRSQGKEHTSLSFQECRSILEAIYGGQRLTLPFEGFLLIGY